MPDFEVAVTVAVHVLAPGRLVKTTEVSVTIFVMVFFPRFSVTVYFFTGDPPTYEGASHETVTDLWDGETARARVTGSGAVPLTCSETAPVETTPLPRNTYRPDLLAHTFNVAVPSDDTVAESFLPEQDCDAPFGG